MKTLVIISHPTISESASQQFFLNALAECQDVTVHHLDQQYGTSQIDVAKELELLKQHQRIIFQFPLYWYSAPAMLKEWQDLVLSASELESGQSLLLAGKELGIVLTVGGKASAYRPGGREGLTIDELMRPYQAVARHMGMTYLSTFTVHQFSYLSESAKMRLLMDYQYYLSGDRSDSLAERTAWLMAQVADTKPYQDTPGMSSKVSQLMTLVRENHEALADFEEIIDEF